MENITIQSIIEDSEEYPFDQFQYEMTSIEAVHSFIVEYLLSVVHIILSISTLASSSVVFYSIYKFKRLRTRTNFILLNFLICITLFSFCTLLIINLESYSAPLYYSYHLLIILTVCSGFLELSLSFALLLAIDWFICANCSIRFANYQRFYKQILIGTYSVVAVLAIATLILVKYLPFHLLGAVCGLTYIISILVLAILNIIKLRRTYSQDALKTCYALTVSNVFFLMLLPFLIMLITMMIVAVSRYSPYSTVVIIACVMYFLEFIAISSPIVIVILLGRLDKHFKMSYDYVFKRSVRSYARSENNLDDDILDIEAS